VKYAELFIEGAFSVALVALIIINARPAAGGGKSNVEKLLQNTIGGTTVGLVTGLQGRSGGY